MVGPGGGVDAPDPDDRPPDAAVACVAELETAPRVGSELDGVVADANRRVAEGGTMADEADGGGGDSVPFALGRTGARPAAALSV